MSLFDTESGRKWLFCMTHPDDEISICAFIARLTLVDPSRVWMSWTHHTSVREQEGRRVAELLAVPNEHLFFHGATDGKVCEEMSGLLPRFREMIESVRPDRIVCGAFEQGHLDHDATNWLVNQCFSGEVVEVPFYHTYLTRLPRVNRFADPTGETSIKLSPTEQSLKKTVAKSYPSQAIWKNMVFAEIWARLTGDGSLLATEHARIQTHRDFSIPNLPPSMAQKVAASAKWRRWMDALARGSG